MTAGDTYDPLEVEAAIDDAYTAAENLEIFGDEVEEAIEMIETLPYSVHRDGHFTREEMIESLDGMFKLEYLAFRIRNPFELDLKMEERHENADEINRIERLLEKEAYRPARQYGEPLVDSEISQ
jgi:hypothetical protein